jgi:hypothetical protein
VEPEILPSEEDQFTSAQAENFKVLRRVIFGAALLVFSLLLWRALAAGGQINSALHGSSLSKLDGATRACLLTVCVLVGLVFTWLASTNLAKILARQVK